MILPINLKSVVQSEMGHHMKNHKDMLQYVDVHFHEMWFKALYLAGLVRFTPQQACSFLVSSRGIASRS